MAIQASAKMANIAGSIYAYVNTQLGSTFSSGAAIDYGGGVPFNDKAYDEWLQVRVLEPARPRQLLGPRAPKATGDTDPPYGQELFHLLSLNIFVRHAALATVNFLRLQTLRDAVLNKFTVQTTIAVSDYAGDNSSLGNLVVEAIEVDGPVHDPERTDLLQWHLGLTLRWVETWT